MVVHDDGKPINLRSPAQWEVLSREYDFEGKEVIDIGCGRGDLLLFAQRAGARVTGVDHNIEIVFLTSEQGIPVIHADLEHYLDTAIVYYDVAFCFSVLPYVDMDRTLRGLKHIADTVFIECQLFGDGPGKLTESEILDKLVKTWRIVTRVGQTIVEGRNTVRPIWKCERGK